ncbi:hypothetical protein COHA_007034 [Chlorella ohadii]|uniref:Serine aminopeptidase S33 domain-containing protein n=1 Tax=Chlorella ohadii TaxID=2649997 RepID=A0AAD5DN54_9CHLO|nr:hypothetical protein COHA_007034 [Chlorella ohadii]
MVDWVKLGIRTAGALGGLVGLAVSLLYFLQEKILYVPRLPGIPNEYPYLPDAFHLNFEDIWLTTKDGLRLHAWLMWPRHWSAEERRRRPTVLFCQENAGNMAFRLPFLKPLTRILDCSAFIFSYRGYGRSEGSPSERGLQLDVEAALEHVLRRTDIDPTKVVLFGRSLGGAVAVYGAVEQQRHLAGLILENTFTRIIDVVPHALPFLAPLVGPGRPCNFLVRNRRDDVPHLKPCNFLVRNHWDNVPRLKQLKALPTLFLSALQDEMLPAPQMKELYELHPRDPWRIVYFPEGRHLDAYDSCAAQYWPAVQEFISSLEPAEPLPPLPAGPAQQAQRGAAGSAAAAEDAEGDGEGGRQARQGEVELEPVAAAASSPHED